MATEKGNDGWIISFLDLFVNAIGCVLLLMVLGIRNGHAVAAKGTNPDALPVMMTVSWSAKAPRVQGEGAGPAALDLRLRRKDGTQSHALPQSAYRSIDLSGRFSGTGADDASKAQEIKRSRLLLFDAPPNTEFQVQAKFGIVSPLRESRENANPYEHLVRSIVQGWDDLGKDQGHRDDVLKQIRKDSENYLHLLASLEKMHMDWLALETRWRESPATDIGARFAEMVSARLRLSRSILESALKEGWGFPDPDFFRRFEAKKAADEPQLVEFESALTDLMLEKAGNDWRREWVANQLSLLDPTFELPLRITLAAPGAKELMEKPYRLKNPLVIDPTTPSWRNLATVRVDERGKVSVDWDPDLRELEEAPKSVMPADPPHQPAAMVESHWEMVYRKYEGSQGDDPLIPRIDKALRFLADQQTPGGEFKTFGAGHAHLNGSAITGLGLMAFLGRGHLVNQEGSQYRELTRRAAENLVTALPAASDGRGQNLYHQGFATIALAQAYPSAKRNGPDKLATDCLNALTGSVDRILDLQGATGGWGYDSHKDDSSVACVMVKAVCDARPYVPADRNDRIEKCLFEAGKFFVACRQPNGSFRYRLGAAFDVAGGGTYRQGGCLLAQHLVESRNRVVGSAAQYDATALKRLLDWQPTADAILREAHCHYGLFYAAHAMLYAEPATADGWFRWSRRKLREVGQQRSGDFGGNSYGTAMAIILLTLPPRHELQTIR